MIKILFSLIVLQGIAFEPMNLLAVMFLCWNLTMMYMKRLWNLFWRNLNLIWSLAFLLDLPHIHHSKKKLESILIVSKLTLIIINCLFHNYYASHFRLMFYILCRNIQPNHFWFVPFYTLQDFFPNPLSSNYLLGYAEDIVRHMASLPSPKSSRSKRSYDHGVVNLIDYETTKCLE